MAYTEASYRANQKYRAAKIKRIPLDVQIEDYDRIKAAADRAGLKVNSYIKEAIEQRMQQDAESK